LEYLYPVANLLSSTVLTAPDPADSGTSIQVQAADADNFPDPSTAGAYNLVVYPSGYQPTRTNAEIVRVTAKSGGGYLTITRAQEGTTAKSIEVGWEISMNITAKMFVDIDTQMGEIESSIPTTFDDLSDGTTNKAYTATEKTKLAGIEDGANKYTHPNHSGDVTSVGDGATTIANGAVTTDKIASGNVTYAKIQNVSAQGKVLGRKSALAGSVEELDIDTDLSSTSASDDTVPSAKATKTYADTKIAKTTNVTAINETGIADGEVAVFNLTNKDIRTSNKTLPTDDVVGTTDTQTLTHKTLTSPKLNEDVAVTIKASELNGILSGWIPAGETWTYASATTFTISGDKTSKYQKEDKVKLAQTTDKYFRITDISYSSPNTTVTVDGFGIYTLANATITNPYYSKMDNPQGFPLKEVLLFSGTPSASVTLSETSDHFDILDIWYEGNNVGGATGIPYYYTRFDTAIDDMFAPAVDMGGIDSAYKIRTSGAYIYRSGTTLTITSGSGVNYSTDTKSDSTVTFSDKKFIPKITRVRGIRW